VNGGIIAMDPHTGRVLSLVGGYSFDQSQFNRVTQAYRQPGSAFKPFVYAAAMDEGYTPATQVLDSPFVAKRDDADECQALLDEQDDQTSAARRISKSKSMLTVMLSRMKTAKFSISRATTPQVNSTACKRSGLVWRNLRTQ